MTSSVDEVIRNTVFPITPERELTDEQEFRMWEAAGIECWLNAQGDEMDDYGMNARQSLGTRIKYHCARVTIWETGDGKTLCFQNTFTNMVNGEEFAIVINTATQDFRPGRDYWIEITADK